MFGLFGPGGMGGGRFEAHYRCYPVTFIDKPEAERGDKIFLPPSALDRLAQLHIDYPMLFHVENRRDGRSTHCGVLEFIADEGMVYMPYWMMQNLLLQEGDIIALRSATLPKGTFVKLQPHSTDFLDISNPRAVLETTLRNFSCLTVGDTIPINYNNKKYFIDIIEAKPGDAISVIETDCNVDFAPPLDYKEPERVPSHPAVPSTSGDGSEPMATESAAPEQTEPAFLAFSGSGRRLDGRSVTHSAPVAIPMPGGKSTASIAGSQSGSLPKSGSAPTRKPGKIMFKDRLAAKFGDGKTTAPVPKPKEEEKTEEEEKSFRAFSGKGHSLKG